MSSYGGLGQYLSAQWTFANTDRGIRFASLSSEDGLIGKSLEPWKRFEMRVLSR